MKVDVDNLAAEIARELSVYSQDIVKKINISSHRVGKAAVRHLKQTSPKKSGKYAKSWTMKTEKSTGQVDRRIIHAKDPHYRVIHLLEFGHAKVGGGRVSGRPHVRPAEERAIKEFTREVEEAIRGG